MTTIQEITARLARLENLKSPLVERITQIEPGRDGDEFEAIKAGLEPLARRQHALVAALAAIVPRTPDEALALGLLMLDAVVFETFEHEMTVSAARRLVEHLSAAAGRSPDSLGIFADALREAEENGEAGC